MTIVVICAFLWNSMTSTSFVFTELANTMKYGGGVLYNLVFTAWRHCVSQNEVWGRGCFITLFSPSDVTASLGLNQYLLTSSQFRTPPLVTLYRPITNTILWTIVGPMLAHRLRRWALTCILWNSIALTSNVFTDLANTIKYGEGGFM